MLENLLKKYLIDDEKVAQFLNDMKTNKVYTTNQENIDVRYKKLNDNFTAKEKELLEAQNLITQLKQSNQGNVDLQAQVTTYEARIKELEAENKAIERDNNLKMELLKNHAKAEDIDYLLFKMQNEKMELKENDKGEITNLNDVVSGLREKYPNQFEQSAKKEVDVKDLPNGKTDNDTLTKADFLKKSYSERVQIANDNPELFNKLLEE